MAIALLTLTTWAAYGGLRSQSLDYTYIIFLPLILIAVQQGYEKATLAVLFINIMSVIFVGDKAQGSNAIILQFGLMAVSFSGVLLGAIVTERQQIQKQLYYRAIHDNLTGLYNRAWFLDRLKQNFTQSQQSDDAQFAVFFLDLDRFKGINTTLGHIVGDQLLVAIADRLKTRFSEHSKLARFGGDEFVLLVENCRGLAAFESVAQQLCETLSQPYQVSGYEIFITVSIGVAVSNFSYELSENLLRDADVALRHSKANGRSQYTLFIQEMHGQAARQISLENDLQHAVRKLTAANKQQLEFEVHYQPIINLNANEITGFEALLRWKKRHQEWVSPSEFIPVAEDVGLIVPLGTWVLQQACEQIQTWQQAFPHFSQLSIAVNFSGRQLLQPALAEAISTVLQNTNLSASSLKVELTESVAMQDFQVTEMLFRELQALGIGLSIDDFGTGYSSLDRLYRLNANILKIDRSFVERITCSRAACEIVRVIIELAHALEMTVVAEGVETTEQAAQLRELHCESGQGYFFARPLPPREIERLLKSA
ncbi:MAG: EAL domain-containing protein [Leptolyngbyaceae cyanobacterium SL_1_1]|nr:EAL domain-containing protein [Leptolyngbyaceae cyanobacterium SL_1_1]